MKRWILGMWHRKRWITPECMARWEPKARPARLVMWLGVVLTVGVLFGTIHHEGTVRESQLCAVVINVHENAKFRAQTEHDNLNQTENYLRDPKAKADTDLYRRVAANLPNVKSRVATADSAVTATRVPPVCMKYEK